ncbi:MAG TPA: O-antigen ligase family protein [candidate division Zixibacteria bacterium]|nr:O-antigen ligase family protein [candidate division Zixibacteria bacterium]
MGERIAAFSQRLSGLQRALLFLLVGAMFINVAKVALGSRYWILLADVVTGVLFLWVTITGLLQGRKWLRIEWLFLAFITIGLAELFNPNVPSMVAGIEGFRRLIFQMLIFFVAVAAATNREYVIKTVHLIGLCAIPILLYGIKQFFFLSGFDYALISANTASIDTWQIFGKTRAFSIFNGPFHLGLFSGFMFWVALTLYAEKKRAWPITLAVLSVLACLASLTRSSVVALAGSIPIVLFFIYRQRRMKIVWITLIVLVVLILIGWILTGLFPEVGMLFGSLSSLDDMSQGTRFTSRFEGYAHGWSLLKSHPAGLGMGSAADAMEQYFEPANKIHVTSHNLFLRVALETGWPGLILFLLMVLLLAQAAFRLRGEGDLPAAMLLSGPLTVIMIAGLTGSSLGAYPINLLLWAFCGLLCGLAMLLGGTTHGR